MPNDQTNNPKPKHPGGAPRTRTPTTWTEQQLTQMDRMAETQCKNTMIALIMGVNEHTLINEMRVRLEEKRAEGKRKLLEVQYDKALRGDTTMLIWVGKQQLDQSDKASTSITPAQGLSAALEWSRKRKPRKGKDL